MKKLLVFALLFIVSAAFGQVQWDPLVDGPFCENGPIGWGNDCNEWNRAYGSFRTFNGEYDFVIFDPEANEWQYCGHEALVYANIELHLWVEMYMYLEYEFTTYKWHRIGRTRADEQVCFIIQGLIQSNSEQYVGLTQLDANNPIGQLTFRGSIFGDPYDYEEDDPNIPITWEARYGAGSTYGADVIMGWTEIEPGPLAGFGPMGVWIPEFVGKCDHWFQFRGCFILFYHIDDGYYSLTIGGCPTPGL
jgi:hypothetical protein